MINVEKHKSQACGSTALC